MKMPAQILAGCLVVFLFLFAAFYAGIRQGRRDVEQWKNNYRMERVIATEWERLARACERGEMTNQSYGSNFVWYNTSPGWRVEDVLSEASTSPNPSLKTHPTNRLDDVRIEHPKTNSWPELNTIFTNEVWIGDSSSGWFKRGTNDILKLGEFDMIAGLQSKYIGNQTNSDIYIFTEQWNAEVYFMDSNKNLFLMVPTTNPVTVRGISK